MSLNGGLDGSKHSSGHPSMKLLLRESLPLSVWRKIGGRAWCQLTADLTPRNTAACRTGVTLPSSQQLLWQFPVHASRQVLGFLGTTVQIFDLGGVSKCVQHALGSLEIPISTLSNLSHLSLVRVAHAVGGVAKTNAPTFSGASKTSPTKTPFDQRTCLNRSQQSQRPPGLHKGWLQHPWMCLHWFLDLGMGQNLVPLVNIKIAGKWMFIRLKMVLIGIDPYPFDDGCCCYVSTCLHPASQNHAAIGKHLLMQFAQVAAHCLSCYFKRTPRRSLKSSAKVYKVYIV